MAESSGWIIGIDEAGRGPLAGPITLACVLCSKRDAPRFLNGIKDSKHLTIRGRETWFKKIKERPNFFHFSVSVGPTIIDREGISKTVKGAIARLLRKAVIKGKLRGIKGQVKGNNKVGLRGIKGDEGVIDGGGGVIGGDKRNKRMKKRWDEFQVLLDGSLSAPKKYKQKTIIKGDEKIPVIAAASIVAKVSRDRKMKRLSRLFSGYAFDVHKGYGTRLHYKMLKKHGPCPIHRRSFLRGLLREG